VFFLKEMAAEGQLIAQILQPVHADGFMIRGRSLPASKTPAGQTEMHAPHATQRFFSIFGSMKCFLLR
jgi:hypothetical protein